MSKIKVSRAAVVFSVVFSASALMNGCGTLRQVPGAGVLLAIPALVDSGVFDIAREMFTTPAAWPSNLHQAGLRFVDGCHTFAGWRGACIARTMPR